MGRIFSLVLVAAVSIVAAPVYNSVADWCNRPDTASEAGKLLITAVESEKGWELSPIGGEGIYNKKANLYVYVDDRRSPHGALVGSKPYCTVARGTKSIDAYTDADCRLLFAPAARLYNKLSQQMLTDTTAATPSDTQLKALEAKLKAYEASNK